MDETFDAAFFFFVRVNFFKAAFEMSRRGDFEERRYAYIYTYIYYVPFYVEFK